MNTTLTPPQPRLRVEFPAESKPAAPTAPRPLTPDHILQTGLGFWASKTLLSATELGLFTELARGPLDAETLRRRLGLHPRSARDFFDALVALGFLERIDAPQAAPAVAGEAPGGSGRDARYANTPDADRFLDRNKPTYVGGLLEMGNARLYGFWGSLTKALRTGKPQNESAVSENLFAGLYSTPERLEGFLQGMTGISLAAAEAIAQQFPWREYETFADVGVAQGAVPVQLALAHPHLQGVGYDLPVVQPVFERYVQAKGLAGRIRFQCGDFFKDRLPSVDVLIMGHILHDWNLEQKKVLIRKAYEALPEGGALIVYEALIDDDRRKNAFGLLMSLNMLIETPGGFDYTGADCQGWLREAGFRETRVEHLAGPDSMVVGIK